MEFYPTPITERIIKKYVEDYPTRTAFINAALIAYDEREQEKELHGLMEQQREMDARLRAIEQKLGLEKAGNMAIPDLSSLLDENEKR